MNNDNIAYMMFGIIIGVIVTALFFPTNFDGDKAINKFEDYLYLKDLPDRITHHINANTTIEQVQYHYEAQPSAKILIKASIREICDGK